MCNCNNREFYWYNIFNAIKSWFEEVSVNKNELSEYEKKIINSQKVKLINHKTHLRVKNPIQKMIPAISLSIICAMIIYYNL